MDQNTYNWGVRIALGWASGPQTPWLPLVLPRLVSPTVMQFGHPMVGDPNSYSIESANSVCSV
jgi:hypothetical protein